MPPPTREQVNALIEKFNGTIPDELWTLRTEVLATLRALQAENDRLRAQASPAWVALSERKPTKEDADDAGYLYLIDAKTHQRTSAHFESPFVQGGAASHFLPLPAPPESAADRQRREDEQAMQKAICGFAHPADLTFCAGFRAALLHARKEATP